MEEYFLDRSSNKIKYDLVLARHVGLNGPHARYAKILRLIIILILISLFLKGHEPTTSRTMGHDFTLSPKRPAIISYFILKLTFIYCILLPLKICLFLVLMILKSDVKSNALRCLVNVFFQIKFSNKGSSEKPSEQSKAKKSLLNFPS